LDEVDYAVFNGESMVREIAAATNKFRLLPVRSPANTVQMVCYNMAHPIFRDRRVRQALSYAINHGKIKKHLLGDKADIVRGPFEKESRQYASGMNEFKYNPKMAIALLKSAGWNQLSRDGIRMRNGRPLRFQLFFGEGLHLDEQLVRQIRIDCIQIGIEVEPIPLSAAALNDSLHRGSFEAVLLRHRFEESADALIDFFGDGWGKGFMNYKSSSFRHVVNLIRRLRKASDIRTAVMRMQLVLNQDQPATFLFHPWLMYYVINAAKFESFLGSDGLPKPFEEWLIRRTP